MSRWPLALMLGAALAMPTPSGAIAADDVAVPEFLGMHACAELAADIELPGGDAEPGSVVLRLEVQHVAGLRLSCLGPSYPEGASFYARSELVPGFRTEARAGVGADDGTFVVDLVFDSILWYFGLPSVTLELWISIEPDSRPVLCSDWAECPVVEITAATLLFEPAVATEPAAWGEIKAIYR